MSKEAPMPIPESELGVDPVQQARTIVNRELLGRDYTPGVLLSKTVQLCDVLMMSNLPRERVFLELEIISGLAAERATAYEDHVTAAKLKEMQETCTQDALTSRRRHYEGVIDNLINGTETLFTVKQLSYLLHIPRTTIYRMFRDGHLMYIDMGELKVPRSLLIESFVRHLTPEPTKHSSSKPRPGM